MSRSLPLVTTTLLLASGCLKEPEPSPDPTDDPGRTTFGWVEVDPSGIEPRWGSFAIEREADTLLLGGVLGSADSVVRDAFSIAPGDSALTVAAEVAMDRARYCHCAMLDAERATLIVLGGRDSGFGDADSASAISLDSGAAETIGDAGAAATPVGCQTFFFPALGRGYVFGGLSSTGGGFGTTTYRYEGATRTFTALSITGPAARYDAATHVLDDGTGLLIGGMGRTGLGAVFYSDAWRFDPVDESWTELPVTGEVPAGRRYPWTAVSPDESLVLYGYGSDSGMGSTVLGDLWALSLTDLTWSPVEAQDAPPPRGFTYRWKGTDAQAGVLGFGFDGANALTDAFALLVPEALQGRWH